MLGETVKILLILLAIVQLQSLEVVRIDQSNYGLVYILPGGFSVDGKSVVSEVDLVNSIVAMYEAHKINNVLAFSFGKDLPVDDAAKKANTIIRKLYPIITTPFYVGRIGVSDEESNLFGSKVAILGWK
jgi:hypothetical protein